MIFARLLCIINITYERIQSDKKFSDYYIVMDKKAQFNEALTSLVDYAATKGNEITQEDVKVFFKDLLTTI